MEDLQEHILTLINLEYYPKYYVDECLKKIRNKTTGWHYNQNVQNLIDYGLVQMITEMLHKTKISQEGIINILWTLTNVCAGTTHQTQLVINLTGLEHFRKFCEDQNYDIAIQALWGLGNIACETKLRFNLLEQGAIQMVCNFLDRPETQNDKGIAIWVLSNLTRGIPKVPYNKVSQALPYLIRALSIQEEDSTIIDALWSLVRLSDYKESHDQFMMNDITTYLKQLKSNNYKIVMPAVRIFGNLCFGDDNCVTHLFEKDCVTWSIQQYEQNRDNLSILIEVVWSLSHFTEAHQTHLIKLPSFILLINELFSNQILYTGIYKRLYLIMRNLSRNKSVIQEIIALQWHTKWINNKDRFNHSQVKESSMECLYFEGIANLAGSQSVFSESQIQTIRSQIEWSSKNFKQKEVQQQMVYTASALNFLIQYSVMEQEEEDEQDDSYSYDNQSMSTKME